MFKKILLHLTPCNYLKLVNETKQENDVTGNIESRVTDSVLSQLTKEPLGVRHAFPAHQTEVSRFYGLWVSMSVWEPLDHYGGCPVPPAPSGPLGEFLVRCFLGYSPCRLGANLGTHGPH